MMASNAIAVAQPADVRTPSIQFTVGSTGQVITLPTELRGTALPALQLPVGPGLTLEQKSRLREALALYKANKPAECEKRLYTLAAQTPKVGAMQALLGEFYSSQGQYAKAQAAYQRAFRATPRAEYADALTLLTFKRAHLEKNWPLLERHCLQQPHSAYAQHVLGIAYQMAGDPVRSLAAFEQATRLNPAFVDAHYNLACLQESLGWLKPARDHYLAALKLQPDAKDALHGLKRVEALQKTADTTKHTDNNPVAQDAVQEAMPVWPKPPEP